MRMIKHIRKSLLLALVIVPAAYGQQQSTANPRTIEERIVRADPSKYHQLTAVHDGAGTMEFRVMLGADAIEPNLIFFHRGVINPKVALALFF